MTTEVVVPELGESVIEATVGLWMVEEGERVNVGDVLVSLETDKVDVEVGAETAGVIASIEREEGEDVAIGDVLALIDPDGEAVAETDTPEEEPAGEVEEEPETAAAEETEGAPQASDGRGAQERATPVARRLAAEKAVDLGEVEGSGPRGRVTKQDVQAHLEGAPPEGKAEGEKTEAKVQEREARAAAPPAPAEAATGREREERIRMSRRRRTIARRLVEAQQTAAMLTTFNEIDMSAVIDIRKRRRDSFKEEHGVKLGFMSFFVNAAVGALKQFPRLNAEIEDDEYVLKHYYDVGMAIGAEEGLVVPVIRDADRMSFAEIEQKIVDYVEAVRENTLSLEDLRGGTFTITNGGVFGSLLSTPILNPPQVAILGLHKIEERPVVVDGEIVIRPMMYVALSYDHRIVDGREAVQFLVKVKTLIEDPEALLLEG